MTTAVTKGVLRRRYEQFIYWSSIGWDALKPTDSSSVYVLGYIKSGTNWLCHLLSGVLGQPILESWKYNFPKSGNYVFHMHRFIPLESVRRRTVYMMRDGRDTVVSHYYQVIRQGGIDRQRFEQHLGRSATIDDIRDNLPEFIRYSQSSRIATTDYRSHLARWSRHRDQYVMVRYEDLLADAVAELARVVQALTGSTPDMELVRGVVKRRDFANVAKRKQGVEDGNAFMRKGVSGDWRNHFSHEAALVYDAYAGDLLLELGYESDQGWADRIV